MAVISDAFLTILFVKKDQNRYYRHRKINANLKHIFIPKNEYPIRDTVILHPSTLESILQFEEDDH